MADIDGQALGSRIASGIRAHLEHQQLMQGQGETLADADDLKSTHSIDTQAADIVAAVLGDSPCNLYVEGFAPRTVQNPAFSVYVDPVDGSLNWDRGVGDPAVVVAIAVGAGADTLGDLAVAYVEGLRSGDRYVTRERDAIFTNGRTGHTTRLACEGPPLAEATGYLRCGYGRAREQLGRTLPLFLAARDVRAFDNAGTEFAEIARCAAHFCVEARGVSDACNLLAYPLIRAAGGALVDLEGRPLDAQPFDASANVDYVLAGSRHLADEIVTLMDRCAADSHACVDKLAATLPNPGLREEGKEG